MQRENENIENVETTENDAQNAKQDDEVSSFEIGWRAVLFYTMA